MNNIYSLKSALKQIKELKEENKRLRNQIDENKQKCLNRDCDSLYRQNVEAGNAVRELDKHRSKIPD